MLFPFTSLFLRYFLNLRLIAVHLIINIITMTNTMIDLETMKKVIEYPQTVKAPDLTSYIWDNNGFEGEPSHWEAEANIATYELHEILDDGAVYRYADQEVFLAEDGELSDPEFID